MSIFLLILILLNPIDSLKSLIKERPNLETILHLNQLYLENREFKKGILLLKKYRRYLDSKEQLLLIYNEAEDYLFAGDIKNAYKQYMEIVIRNPDDEIANDALERLYLLEIGRVDTTLLKRFLRTIYLYKIRKYHQAIDTLKTLLNSKFGAYAYYYLALVYNDIEDPAQSYAVLKEMRKAHPKNRIYDATILLAEMALKLDKKKEAKEVLEGLILTVPNSIYAMRAREIISENGLE